jgi:hypothetical protein
MPISRILPMPRPDRLSGEYVVIVGSFHP